MSNWELVDANMAAALFWMQLVKAVVVLEVVFVAGYALWAWRASRQEGP